MIKSSSIQIDKSIILAAFLPFVLSSACRSEKEKAQKPNIILVMTDDQGYGDLACNGNKWINTPNLDNLHSQSVRLTDFHVSPTSAPTRAALLTGHYSNRTGVWHTIGGRSLIKEGEITVADVLKENGYATGIFGKWHLGDNYPFRPQDRGFDEVLIHKGGGWDKPPIIGIMTISMIHIFIMVKLFKLMDFVPISGLKMP